MEFPAVTVWLAGVTLNVKSGGAVIAIAVVAVFVLFPNAPVTVIEYEPSCVDVIVEIVNVDVAVPLIVDGLSLGDAPEGRPLADKDIDLLNPFWPTIEIVYVAGLPAETLALGGEIVME